MKRLNVTVQCMAVYNSSIEVPDDMTLEEAIEYANEHLDKIPCNKLEYVPDSDILDEENCDFDEEDYSSESNEFKFKVKYEDNTGNGDGITAYKTEKEAEMAIEEELENCKEWMQSEGYDYGDFGRKTEIWVPNGNEYASWERLWK